MTHIQVGRRLSRAALAGAAVIAAVGALAVPVQAAAVPSRLWAWGMGPLGIGTIGPRNHAVPVHGLPAFPIKQVVSYGAATRLVAALVDGDVWTWGGGGPLGNGGTTSSLVPVRVTSLSGIRQLAATTSNNPGLGPFTVYALRNDGTVWAWGIGTSGALGNGTMNSSDVPVRVRRLTGVTSITASGGTAYALRSDGTVWAWGAGASGQLGNGNTANSDVPVHVSLSSKVRQLSTACNTAYALTTGNRIFAWGANNDGQLGDGTKTTSTTPVQVRRITGASSVVGQCLHAYAVVGGTVRAWGLGAQGENGDGHKATRLIPVTVTGLSNVVSVSADFETGYAVRSDGTAWAWGYGLQGDLGNGQYANSSVPVQITAITSPVRSVTPAGNSLMAVGTDGSVWSWGYSGFGANGSGGTGANPGRVPGVPATRAVFPADPGPAWFAAVK